MMIQAMNWHPQILEEAGITYEAVNQLNEQLETYLDIYSKCYVRSEQRTHGENYVKGLLSELERKSIEPIALQFAAPSNVRSLQNFAQTGSWDDERMLCIYQTRLSLSLSDKDGMYTVDGSDFPKKGNESAGVARQYCGALGKTENCQAGVFIGYCSIKGYGLIDKQLYLPEKWHGEDYKERWDKCGIPKGTDFKTKPELASEMLKSIAASGKFPARWVGVDSAFGRDKAFLDAIPEGMYYFADVPVNTLGFSEKPTVAIPAYSGKGRRDLKPKPAFAPVSVADIAAANGDKWSRVCLGEGAKGPIMADEMILRVFDCREGLPGSCLWLYVRRLSDGTLKFSLSNAPYDTSLETLRSLATRRWTIEQCFEECKLYLGMDHYEGRSWNAWHRHMLFVFIAHLFVLELRLSLKKTYPF